MLCTNCDQPYQPKRSGDTGFCNTACEAEFYINQKASGNNKKESITLPEPAGINLLPKPSSSSQNNNMQEDYFKKLYEQRDKDYRDAMTLFHEQKDLASTLQVKVDTLEEKHKNAEEHFDKRLELALKEAELDNKAKDGSLNGFDKAKDLLSTFIPGGFKDILDGYAHIKHGPGSVAENTEKSTEIPSALAGLDDTSQGKLNTLLTVMQNPEYCPNPGEIISLYDQLLRINWKIPDQMKPLANTIKKAFDKIPKPQPQP